MRDDAPSGLSIGWQHIHSICECRNRLNYYKAINAMKWHKKKRVEMAQTSQTRTLCRIISFMEFNRRFCGAILLSSWFFSFSPKRLFRVEILLVRVLLLRGCLRHLIALMNAYAVARTHIAIRVRVRVQLEPAEAFSSRSDVRYLSVMCISCSFHLMAGRHSVHPRNRRRSAALALPLCLCELIRRRHRQQRWGCVVSV